MIKEAYATVNFSDSNINPGAQFGNLSGLLNQTLPVVMIVASLVCLAMLLMGAFSYVTSSGEQEKLQKARKTITYSIIGLILIFLSYLMVRIMSYFTGISLFF